jgi:hypothetical protein
MSLDEFSIGHGDPFESLNVFELCQNNSSLVSDAIALYYICTFIR